MAGKFITFEGGEGAGKTTQTELLKEYFALRGVDALFTREPGGTAAAERIRDVIKDIALGMDPMTELLLYCAARADHVRRVIKPALESGRLVVCDRFSDSTFAYQVYGRGLAAEDVRRLNEIAAGGLVPDLTFFLDCPPKAGFSRKGGADKTDRMENAGGDFHERVYRGFCELAAVEPQRIIRVDAGKKPDEVHGEIVGFLRERKIIEY